ncbi:MAG: exodeoxyribonuclease III [Pirellulales bacterium]|nr:exodeoxyribonuclease III [Pirellulales bacterium]
MILASWNVNSIRARQERLAAWLDKVRPDVACLQELKVVDEAFPHASLEALGYHAATFGQKTYNGVAVLSRTKITRTIRGLGDDDPQARFLAVDVDKLHVLCAYVPNGQEVGSDKWAYKLAWMERLRAFLDAHYSPEDRLVLCGDFNVARDDLDVARPDDWVGSVLCHDDARQRFQAILDWGLVDVFRRQHPGGGLYSWWDYRMLGFPRNHGLRIDYVLATESVAKKCVAAKIDRDERKGEKPSDHAPVVVEFVA